MGCGYGCVMIAGSVLALMMFGLIIHLALRKG